MTPVEINHKMILYLRPLPQKRLNRIVQAKAIQINSWSEGVSLERDSGLSIVALRLLGAAARFRLALDHRKHGNVLLSASPACYRGAISRYYYSLYHGIRACAYLHHGGDDYEDHSTLPAQVPTTLPAGLAWADILKDARLARNAADYDPFPRVSTAMKLQAEDMKKTVNKALPLLRRHLRQEGCHL